MWEISVNNQIFGTLCSIPVGAAFCLLYDLLRIFRKSFRPPFAVDFFLDIAYWILCAFATFSVFLVFSSGQVRWYILFGLFVGFLAFRFTVSRLLIAVSFRLIRIFKKIFSAINRRINKLFSIIGRILVVLIKKIMGMIKKLLQPLCKMLYNLKNQLLFSKKRQTSDHQ